MTTTSTTTTTTTTTFHLFPHLPFELRALIWDFTMQPREVDVLIKDMLTISRTPVPAPLHACRESRNHLTGMTSNGEPNTTTGTRKRRQPLYEKSFQFTTSANPRYVWINFSLDLLSIGTTSLHLFTDPIYSDQEYKNKIKRLKFEREYSATYHGFYFFHWESRLIQEFEAVEEVHIVCADGIYAFEGITEDNYFPCGAENVLLIDGTTGERMGAVELDALAEREREEEARRGGWWVSDEEDEDAGSDAGS